MSIFGTLRGEHDRPQGVMGEWELIPPEKRTPIQQLAAETSGVFTPGNLISTIGFTDGYFGGLFEYVNEEKTHGAKRFVRARAADLLDGLTAKHTGTRSAMGAVVDASYDKLMAVGADIALFKDPISIPKTVASLALQITILASSMVIDKRGGNPDPTPAGKIAMAAKGLRDAAYMREAGYIQLGVKSPPQIICAIRKAAEATYFISASLVAYRYGKAAFKLQNEPKVYMFNEYSM